MYGMNVFTININRNAFLLSLRIRPYLNRHRYALLPFLYHHYHQQPKRRGFASSSITPAMAPSKQRAVVINADGTVGLQEVDVPRPGKGEILIKIVAAAQNPTDW